jgi:hypothetical protein
MQNVRLQIGLERLHLGETADPRVGHDAHDRAPAEDRAFQVDDLHSLPPV